MGAVRSPQVQAAQQVKFTEDARRAVVLAQDEVRSLGHKTVGTEHLLLGLLSVGDERVARAFRSLGLEYEEVRAAVASESPPAGGPDEGAIPFEDPVRRVLELALREAVMSASGEIAPEHLLVALAAEAEGGAAKILRERGADALRVRETVFGGSGHN